MPDRPNILLILTDQQSASMMSCVGNTYLRTPAMDALAASGIRFDRAYCTNPVCIPSRFSLVTGLMPSAIGMTSNDTSHITALPDAIRHNGLGWLLRRAGYRPAYAGKVHLPHLSAEDVGFDYLCSDERDELARVCADFLRATPGEPFFLMASFINPHDICYMAIRESMQDESERGIISRGTVALRTLDAALQRPPGVSDDGFFRDHCPPLPPNFELQTDEPEVISLMLDQRPFRMKARREWSDLRWREHRWAYARLTEVVDAQIARILDALRDTGLDRSTLVIFTSDHGDMDGAHRMEHKSTLYEEVCRIPLIVCLPDDAAPTGRVDREHLVSNGLDLLPTICDYAGVSVPDGLTGRSIRPLLDGGRADSWRHSLPLESAVGRAVVTERFKYAVYDLSKRPEHLIDLQEDPGETRSVLCDPRCARVLDELRADFRRTFGDGPRSPTEIMRAMPGA